MKNPNYAGLPDALCEALSRCDLLVGEETVDYLYELYDPATGGFYYSISSRDTKEMTPFSEGTRFAIEALRYGGIEFPDWWKAKAGAWILAHQDEGEEGKEKEKQGQIRASCERLDPLYAKIPAK